MLSGTILVKTAAGAALRYLLSTVILKANVLDKA